MKRKLLFHILISLALGGGMYLLLRPEALITRWCYGLLGAAPPAAVVGPALRLLCNHLADMLWAWALTCSAYLSLGREYCRAAAIAAVCTGIFV